MHFSYIELDEFVIMPDHLHGIIIIINPYRRNNYFVDSGHALNLQNQHPRFRNQGKDTLSAIIGSFKSAVTKQCNIKDIKFGWQSRFYDQIIRNEKKLFHIRNYIQNNPQNWKPDSINQ